MKTKRPAHTPPPSRQPQRGRFVFGILLALMLGIGAQSVAPKPADALFGLPSVSVTVGDIPRRIADFINAAANRVQEALKIASDIAFKNSLEAFNARIAQEVLTQISATGPGQKPLFLTNPKTFFRNVADTAAGDFIDNFSRGLTGRTGPGSSTSSTRQRFLISRILRSAIGSPTAQCRASCERSFSVINAPGPNFTGPVPEQNLHEQRISAVLARIQSAGGTQETYDRNPNQTMTCRDVALPAGPAVQGGYIPWQISIGACSNSGDPNCTTTARECLRRQNEAINTERSVAQQETTQCFRDCQSGGAAATEQLVNDLTATDIFAAVGQLNTAEATRAVSVALSNDRSDFGQLLSAAAELSAAVADRVTGEQTLQNSGVLPRTSRVSEVVLVPREAGQQSLLTALAGGQQAQQVYTGTSAADIIKGVAAFINSPIGKILTNFFKSKCGLNPSACGGPSGASSAIGQLLFGSGNATGLAGARLQFAQLGQIEFRTGDPGRNEVDITGELTSAGLIDAQFRSAIEDQKTIQEALDEGLLDPQKTFGFDKNGVQAVNGYSYRALQYLRKFRVTPVGWEIAAQYSRQADPRDLSLGFLTQHYAICAQSGKVKQCNVDGTSCLTDADCSGSQTCDERDEFASPANQVCSNNITTACTADSDCTGGTCGASPYCGLVDPNWVLKAPQTYCRRQGAGEEIITKEFVCDQNNINSVTGDVITDASQIEFGTPDQDSGIPNCVASANNPNPDIGRWIISRNANTCADTQSCIAENEDGTCIAYGYCVQERQTFKFDGTQCDAQNASCTTYTDSSGQRASYLASTLDFRNCNAEAAGCQWYCSAFDENTGQWLCSEPAVNDNPNVANDIVRFSDNVETCSQSAAGCRQFIRTTANSNLLPNGGFETFSGGAIDGPNAVIFTGWTNAGGATAFAVSADDSAVTGNNAAAASLAGTNASAIQATVDTGSALYERVFVGSVRARSLAGATCDARLRLITDQTQVSEVVSVTSGWETHQVTMIVPEATQVQFNSNALTFAIELNGCAGGGLVVDSAQLEEGSQTQYKSYGTINVLHLNGNRLACSNDDVGCEAYRPRAGGPAITAQVRNSNRCSEGNVGCATFQLEPFDNGPISRAGGLVNIVPQRGQQCSAAYVGCEEYTNLDTVAQGGEGKEYFTSVKQCVKPDSTSANQVTYYTWIGDAARGFVLQAHTLLKSNLSDAPCTNVGVVTAQGATPTCSDTIGTIAACTAADLATNPDCAEYYDSALNVHYRLRSQTVSVTEDCHPYRNTLDQTEGNPDNIYFLAPRENVSCPAAFAGCRAYTGNNGRTARIIFTDTFETGTTTNWIGGSNVTASPNLGGHSMLIPQGSGTSAAFTQASTLSGQLAAGKSYIVSFLGAAADAAANGRTIAAAFGTATGNSFNAELPLCGGAGQPACPTVQWDTTVSPNGPRWQQYTFGPIQLDLGDYRLGITVSGANVFVDNVTLTEINDSLYLVKPSVPICPASEVGCAAYTDRAGTEHFLKSFSRICSEEVVGCEALIDTQNSSSPFAQSVKNEFTPADQVVTYVNNRSTYCSAANKGCQAFGLPLYTNDRTITGYRTVYYKNNPDRHSTDICLQEELMCQAYTTSNGTAAFFKDPTFQTCEFIQDGSEIGGAWYIKGTTYRCPIVTPPTEGRPIGASCSPICAAGERAGRACVFDSDCPGSTCEGDSTTIGKIADGSGNTTFGQCTIDPQTGTDNCLGGNRCVYLAGECPEGQNGCNEYRDPSDPPGCRSECPLILQGGSPVYLDRDCQATQCIGNPQTAGQNCQSSTQCGSGGTCVDTNGNQVNGFAGCRSYFYLRQSVEDNSAECNGQIDTEIGCRPFNDTSKESLNYRGE